jgi:hypothetical protein
MSDAMRGRPGSEHTHLGAEPQRWTVAWPTLALALAILAPAPEAVAGDQPSSTLQQAKMFLAAADYRRAIEACQREVEARPSAASYVYLTYAYHALDAYLEHLAKTERWVGVEHVYLNLASNGVQDLVDQPTVLARIAKELIQGSAQQQADITAAMANRLDQQTTTRLWTQQTDWRKAKPDSWWAAPPAAWGW